jgi:hypothetical protein
MRETDRPQNQIEGSNATGRDSFLVRGRVKMTSSASSFESFLDFPLFVNLPT